MSFNNQIRYKINNYTNTIIIIIINTLKVGKKIVQLTKLKRNKIINKI